MFNGLGECFRRALWESSLGEQLERVAVKVKNKVKNCFQCAKNLGEYRGRLAWESNFGEQYRREALDY